VRRLHAARSGARTRRLKASGDLTLLAVAKYQPPPLPGGNRPHRPSAPVVREDIHPFACVRRTAPPAAPTPVRAWANALPAWLEVLSVAASDDPAFQDDGEKSALTLGMTLGADLILIDDRKGAAVALQKGFQITGTLGVLTRSAQRGLLDLADALARLKRTNFHYRQELFDDVLKKYTQRGDV